MTTPTTPIQTYNRRAVPGDPSVLGDWLKTELLTVQRAIFRPNTITVTADYTINASTDDVVLVDATAGPVTITWPDPTRAQHFTATVKKIDSSGNAVTFASTIATTSAAATFDGAASPTLVSQWDARTERSNGVAYYAITDTTPAIFTGLVPASQVTAGTFGAGSYGIASGDLLFTGNFGYSNPSGNGQGILGTDAASGLLLVGQGSIYDVEIDNKSGTAVAGVLTGTMTFAMLGGATIAGDLNVNSGKFTVDHATGNVVQGPSLQIVGGSDTYEWLSSTSFLLTNITTSTILAEVTAAGDLNLLGALNAIGGLKVNTSKFTVAASTGNGVFAGTVTASNLSGTNTGDQTNISGNAATATLAAASTKLATARAINGVNFDGTAGITLTTATGGWTVSGGNLVSDSDLIVGVSSTFTVAAPSGNTVSAGTLFNQGNVGIGATGPTSTSPLNIIGLPTSAVGLATGDIYSLAGVLHVV